MSNEKMTYLEAGVDVEKGDAFVSKISRFIRDTYDSRVVSGVGGFAALYEMDEDRYLAAGTDGVGTKVKLAIDLNIHHTIGQDLVAMCVNDVLCTGARPLFFLDYLATGKLDVEVHGALVEGIANACKLSGCALIGGETAEMPGIYAEGIYDLAGFSVGEVYKSDWLSPHKVIPGLTLIGIASSGFHSNGYSLIRKLIKDDELKLKKELLTPTRIYVPLIQKCMREHRGLIRGLAHITGGGFQNIERMNDKLKYTITRYPAQEFRGAAMNEIIKRSQLSHEELYQTFNMGIGMVMAVTDADVAMKFLASAGEKAMVLGRIEN
jgi:phosphoribosylformylglycinamidine cyclo-ligase